MRASQMILMGGICSLSLGIAGWVISQNPKPLYSAGNGPLAEPPAEAERLAAAPGSPVESMEIVFVRLPGDSLQVRTADDATVLRQYGPLEGGFMRGALRPLERERVRSRTALSEPYRVVRDQVGRLTLHDVGSNLQLDLAAFGPTSRALFASLLDGSESPTVPPLFVTN